MPGTKRTFSTAFPGSSPSRLKRKSTSTASARSTSAYVATPILPRPSLQKASTLTLEDIGAAEEPLVKRSSTLSKGRPASLVKKTSVEQGALVSRLSGLKSGSIVGETTLAEMPTISKKVSSVRTPSVPSGLTKLAMSKTGTHGSLRVSKSQLIDGVDEVEITTALESLKSKMSKTDTKTSMASAKSASLKSAKSVTISRTSSSVVGAADASAAETSTGPIDPALPPCGLVEVVISFDTTGSMYGCLAEVRAKIKDLIQRLQADIPGIRIAIIAHGDYCDVSKYIVKWVDFGASLPELCDFVETVEGTHGGDGPECYELVLLRTRQTLAWTPGSQRLLIMINDDIPHEPGYTYGGKTYQIDWRHECNELKNMGVKIYGVRSGNDSGSIRFNDEIARITGGQHVQLENFNSIFDFIMMICYREANPDMVAVYEAEMRARDQRIAKDSEVVAKAFRTAPAPVGLFSAVTPKKTVPKRTPAKVAKKTPKKATGKTSVKSKKTTVDRKGAKGVRKGKKAGKKSSKVLLREKVSDAKLSTGKLKTLTWSKWLLVISPVAVKTKAKSKKSLFGNKSRTPAIYEFAVSLPGTKAGKKYVVYLRATTGYNSKKSWESYMLKNGSVRKEVDLCVNAGCSIWVRQGLPKGRSIAQQKKKVTALRGLIMTGFDYAWKKYIRTKTDGHIYHRQLKVTRRGAGAITISHGDI